MLYWADRAGKLAGHWKTMSLFFKQYTVLVICELKISMQRIITKEPPEGAREPVFSLVGRPLRAEAPETQCDGAWCTSPASGKPERALGKLLNISTPQNPHEDGSKMLRMVKSLGCCGVTMLPRMSTPVLLAVGPSRTPPPTLQSKRV